jgi:hypothetical protein
MRWLSGGLLLVAASCSPRPGFQTGESPSRRSAQGVLYTRGAYCCQNAAVAIRGWWYAKDRAVKERNGREAAARPPAGSPQYPAPSGTVR